MIGTIGADDAKDAMADYVAALSEVAKFEAFGEFGDGMLQNPAHVLSLEYAAQSLPDYGGGTISLSPDEVDRYREAAGVL